MNRILRMGWVLLPLVLLPILAGCPGVACDGYERPARYAEMADAPPPPRCQTAQVYGDWVNAFLARGKDPEDQATFRGFWREPQQPGGMPDLPAALRWEFDAYLLGGCAAHEAFSGRSHLQAIWPQYQPFLSYFLEAAEAEAYCLQLDFSDPLDAPLPYISSANDATSLLLVSVVDGSNLSETPRERALMAVSRRDKRERGMWQRRFWEHQVRDPDDLQRCIDYVHYNPVKHGLVATIDPWPWSTYHRYRRRGDYADDDWQHVLATEPLREAAE